MPTRELNPEDAIDRSVEKAEFDGLVGFTPGEDARLLIIRDDKPDSGKTTLLRQLRYNCESSKPAKPVGLIPLDDNREKITSSFDLVKRIVEAFSSPDFDTFDPLDFPTFQTVNNRRVHHIFTEVSASSGQHTGTVHAEGAQFGPSSVLGGIVMTNPTQFTVNAQEWGSEQEDLARQECLKAFFTDLKVLGDKGPVIILLDSFDERSERDVREWILKKLVTICFDLKNRPAQFVLVVAGRGRELPDFNRKSDFAHLVKSRNSLEDWSEDHVRDFLEVHDYDDLTDQEFEMIWAQVQKGEPIGRVLKLVDLIKRWKSGSHAA